MPALVRSRDKLPPARATPNTPATVSREHVPNPHRCTTEHQPQIVKPNSIERLPSRLTTGEVLRWPLVKKEKKGKKKKKKRNRRTFPATSTFRSKVTTNQYTRMLFLYKLGESLLQSIVRRDNKLEYTRMFAASERAPRYFANGPRIVQARRKTIWHQSREILGKRQCRCPGAWHQSKETCI